MYLLFSFFLIFHSVNAALNTEQIVGGYPAFKPNHKYQAAIIGKYNGSDTRYLVCSGGIIGEFFVLTGFVCFFNKGSFELKRQTFYVLVNSTQLTATEPVEREIDKIYTAGHFYNQYFTDLAVAKVKEGFGLINNEHLVSLKIPQAISQTYKRSGCVSAYGKETNGASINYPSVTQIRIASRLSLNLTYAFATISSDEDCQKAHIHAQKLFQFCAVIKPDWNFRIRGICRGDIGAPLVDHNGIVLGIAITKNVDCDDTEKGSVYANVSFYKKFFDAVLSGNYVGIGITPFIFYNRPYNNGLSNY